MEFCIVQADTVRSYQFLLMCFSPVLVKSCEALQLHLPIFYIYVLESPKETILHQSIEKKKPVFLGNCSTFINVFYMPALPCAMAPRILKRHIKSELYENNFSRLLIRTTIIRQTNVYPFYGSITH